MRVSSGSPRRASVPVSAELVPTALWHLSPADDGHDVATSASALVESQWRPSSPVAHGSSRSENACFNQSTVVLKGFYRCLDRGYAGPEGGLELPGTAGISCMKLDIGQETRITARASHLSVYHRRTIVGRREGYSAGHSWPGACTASRVFLLRVPLVRAGALFPPRRQPPANLLSRWTRLTTNEGSPPPRLIIQQPVRCELSSTILVPLSCMPLGHDNVLPLSAPARTRGPLNKATQATPPRKPLRLRKISTAGANSMQSSLGLPPSLTRVPVNVTLS